MDISDIFVNELAFSAFICGAAFVFSILAFLSMLDLIYAFIEGYRNRFKKKDESEFQSQK